MLKIRTELEKIAKLLNDEYEGTICFDHSSYDDELDIPSIDVDGERVLVEQVFVNEDASVLTIVDSEGNTYTCNFNDIPEEWDDDYFCEIGLDVLLRDIYYETNASYEIGDYELDFLGDKIN